MFTPEERTGLLGATILPDDIPYLYLSQDDFFRLGNVGSAKLNHVRPADVDTYEQNGISMVVANKRGVPLFTEEGIARLRGGWLWRIPSGTPMPEGLALHNDHGAHFMICPARDMTLDGYKALLSELALQCERFRKV